MDTALVNLRREWLHAPSPLSPPPTPSLPSAPLYRPPSGEHPVLGTLDCLLDPRYDGMIADVIYEVRGTPVGHLEGVVVDAIVDPVPNGRIFILHDPDTSVIWTDVRDVIAANWKALGEPWEKVPP